jgi:hypothetical protein
VARFADRDAVQPRALEKLWRVQASRTQHGVHRRLEKLAEGVDEGRVRAAAHAPPPARAWRGWRCRRGVRAAVFLDSCTPLWLP